MAMPKYYVIIIIIIDAKRRTKSNFQDVMSHTHTISVTPNACIRNNLHYNKLKFFCPYFVAFEYSSWSVQCSISVECARIGKLEADHWSQNARRSRHSGRIHYILFQLNHVHYDDQQPKLMPAADRHFHFHLNHISVEFVSAFFLCGYLFPDVRGGDWRQWKFMKQNRKTKRLCDESVMWHGVRRTSSYHKRPNTNASEKNIY